MRNFECIEHDFDNQVYKKTLIGKLTLKRWYIINSYVEKYNNDNSHPYGLSPNGYAYSCGCEHDCCGCLVSNTMSIKQVKKDHIEVIISIRYNY